jgi:ribosome modulation factor
MRPFPIELGRSLMPTRSRCGLVPSGSFLFLEAGMTAIEAAYRKGCTAAMACASEEECPYVNRRAERFRQAWLEGFRDTAATRDSSVLAVVGAHHSIAEQIRVAAYYAAESHGFSGDPVAHWLEGKRKIKERLKGRDRAQLDVPIPT